MTQGAVVQKNITAQASRCIEEAAQAVVVSSGCVLEMRRLNVSTRRT